MDRIKTRVPDCLELIDKGLSLTNLNCMKFLKSKFVVMIKDEIIVTIREDLDWVFEDFKNNSLLEQIVNKTDCDNEGYKVNVIYDEDRVMLEYIDKFDCCLINL